jgi:hypothetical protein
MKPPNIVTVHFLSAKWSKKLFTINHYELQNGKCIVTQELSAYGRPAGTPELLPKIMYADVTLREKKSPVIWAKALI